jgi:uncharacterized protein involved in exopolysaccharide biosynthesis
MLTCPTMARNAAPDVPVDASADEGDLNVEQLKELAGFFLRAPRRHRPLAIGVMVVTVLIGFAVASFWPRTYNCDVRILAQRNLVLPALDNPSITVPRDADNPTKNAADAILRRDNIVSMVEQLGLVDRWDATRQPILKFKDRITGWGAAPRPEEERVRDIVGLLDKRLLVVTDDSSITISIDWPDRQTAFDIISFLQKNFLEARYDSNVNVIVEAIKILEDRAKPEEADVDAALSDLRRIYTDRAAERQTGIRAPTGRPTRGTARAPAAVVDGHAGSQAAPDMSGDAQALDDVRRRMRILQEEHDRAIAQAQTQLTDARATLGPLHPTVLALNEKLEELSKPSPELAALSAQERDLVARLAGPSAAPTTATPSPAAPAPARPPSAAAGASSAALPAVVAPGAVPMDDPQIAVAMARLQVVSSKYNELLSRIEAAKIELEVTRAAFKYQYTVVRPPELARAPTKPNVRAILLLTLLATVMSAFLVPGLLDVWRGRLLEAWEVERRLKIPVLGELMPPPPQ